MDKRTFYRVCHKDSQKSLWYDQEGQFTGLIHGKFNFCQNYSLEMDFDPEVVGFLSATDSLDQLAVWFTDSDIKMLHEHGYRVHAYESDNYKFYDKFQHYLISQKDSRVIEVLEGLEVEHG